MGEIGFSPSPSERAFAVGMERASTAPYSSTRGSGGLTPTLMSTHRRGVGGGPGSTGAGAAVGSGTASGTNEREVKSSTRSDRLRDSTDRVPSNIPQWTRGDIDVQQRQQELLSGGRKASRTQPYLPIGCPVLEMPHPIDLLHGRQPHDGLGSGRHETNNSLTTMTTFQGSISMKTRASGTRDGVGMSVDGHIQGLSSPLTLLTERPHSQHDSFGPWQTLKRRARESSKNVRACKYGANFLEQLSGKAHRLTQRTSKSLQQQIQIHQQQRQKQNQDSLFQPAQPQNIEDSNGNSIPFPHASTTKGKTYDNQHFLASSYRGGAHRPHTAPADLDSTNNQYNLPASFDSSRQINSSRPRVLSSYTKNISNIKNHLLPYEHAMTFEALFTHSENALKSINSKLEAKLAKMEETREKNYQRKYSAVTEIGSANSHINFRKHLRAVRCKMALEATREALEMIRSHPWYGELNHKLEETYRLCGHVSVGESFLVEDVGKVLSEGKHFTKSHFRNTLMRLPLEAHQLLEVQDIIYFIGNKVGMNREEYRHWMGVFGRAQADDIIRAYDRIRRGQANTSSGNDENVDDGKNGQGASMLGGGDDESGQDADRTNVDGTQINGDIGGDGGIRSNGPDDGNVDNDTGNSDGSKMKVTTKKISAAKFLQLRSIAFAGDKNESEDSIQEESLSDVNNGSWRFLKSYSSRQGTQRVLDVGGHGETLGNVVVNELSMLYGNPANRMDSGGVIAAATGNNEVVEGAIESNQLQSIHSLKAYRSGLPSLRTALDSGLAANLASSGAAATATIEQQQ